MNCDGHFTKRRHGQALKAKHLQPLGDALTTVTQHYTPQARDTPETLSAAAQAHSTHTFVKVTQKT